ncbi:GDSL-type esterase/lipase family protein [Lederbergia graminis]|uniref:GDSL-type esterase/lipase family protein n=1 Tax=Lederbergia graminis TaxID=735518 RepID=A0ABW0LL99_9BACI
MRRLVTALAVIACVIFLVLGNFYWKEKTDISSFARNEKVGDTVDEDQKQSEEKNKDEDDNSDGDASEEEADVDSLTLKAANWPEDARNALVTAAEAGEEFVLAIVGSQSLGGDEGWASMLEEALEEEYAGVMDVQIYKYEGATSQEFVEGEYMEEVVAATPDLVLLEPFPLNDNSGWISVEMNQANIQTFVDALNEARAEDAQDAVVMLQPAHPIYNATGYPRQIDQLKEFAESEGFEYLDHWSDWPDHASEEILDYLEEGQSAPSEAGHQVWFEYLLEYFVEK